MRFTRTLVYVYFALVKAKTAKCAFQFWFDDLKETTAVFQRHTSSRGISRGMSLQRTRKKILKFINRAQKALSLFAMHSYFLFLYEQIYWTRNWEAFAGHGRSHARFCVTLSVCVIYRVKSHMIQHQSRDILQSSLFRLEMKSGRAYIFYSS